MDYFRPIKTADELTLSIDNLVIDYHVGAQKDRDELSHVLNMLDMTFSVIVRHWSSLRIGTFRENFSIAFLDGASFWLGVGLNEIKPNFGRVRLEANPAHCATHHVFWYLLGWLNTKCKSFRTCIKRYDLAIDIEADRSDVEILKDHRAYVEIRKSRTDRTQYMGQRSRCNRVKCYNKSLESKLIGEQITRLELTIDPQTPYQDISWPKAYVVQNRQARIDELCRLTDTERTLLDGVLAGTIDLSRLGRKTRLKMEQYMMGYVQWITVGLNDYQKILEQIHDFWNYPRTTLKVEPIYGDELPEKKLLPPSWLSKAKQSLIELIDCQEEEVEEDTAPIK